MGIAGWHECGVHASYPTKYAAYPDLTFPDTFVPCAWRTDFYEELGLDKQAGWTEEDMKEMREIRNDDFMTTWLGYDRGRINEMGDKAHWYLAPLCVWQKWRSRGVGKELLKWGLDRADEQGVPAILEAFPNARPVISTPYHSQIQGLTALQVYYHLGFKPTASHGPFKDTQLLRPVPGKP
jgi:GNAT superfamily N-acetyltransferase